MRSVLVRAGCAALLLGASDARAERPDGVLAVAVGASVSVGGLLIGGALLGQGGEDSANAGWLAMQSGLTLAPLAAHAVFGEWGRGAAFAAAPAAATAATSVILATQPNVLAKGNLDTQRALWGLLTGSVVVAALGVHDAIGAPDRARRVAFTPIFDGRTIGLRVGGAL